MSRRRNVRCDKRRQKLLCRLSVCLNQTHMCENDILDDGDEPFAVFWVLIANAVELGCLRDVRPATDPVIGVAVDNVLIDVFAFEVIYCIFGVAP